MAISRRRFARVAFLGGIAAAGAGGIGAILNYLYPRGLDRGEPETIAIPAADVPPPGGEPLLNKEFGFYLVNLADEDRTYGARGVSSGLLAISTECPHLAGECPVRWSPDHEFVSPFNGATVEGWMVCPCHGSTFTRAGARVFGPSPQSLATLRLGESDGRVVVHLDEITEGGVDAGVEPLPWP